MVVGGPERLHFRLMERLGVFIQAQTSRVTRHLCAGIEDLNGP